jgi:hypothetical protein
MKFKFLSIFIFSILAFSKLAAQNGAEKLPNRIMYTKYYAADFFTDSTKWAWELDVVYRRQSQLNQGNFWSDPLRFSFRPWIAYQVNKLTRVSFSPIGVFHSAPRFSQNSDLDRPFEKELRTTLQINNYSNYGRFNFTHRIRLESRWRGVNDEFEDVSHNFRMRYRLRLRIPLNNSYFYANNTIYTSMYSEVHVEWGSGHGTNFFTQNRNYIGLGYRFWDWTRIELGCIYQVNTRGNNTQMDVSIGPMFYLFFDILSRNKKKYDYSF